MKKNRIVQAFQALTYDGDNSHQSKQLAPALTYVLQEVQREIGILGGGSHSTSELTQLIEKTALRTGLTLTPFEKDEVLSFLEADEKPFGLLQPLVDDPSISDIICRGSSQIDIQVGRKNIQADIQFPSQEQYESFVEKLLHQAGSTYSTKQPIADGMIGSFARVHVVHRSIAEAGPYVTIRLNRFSTVTITDLVDKSLAPVEILKYLQGIVTAGHTLMIAGEVGTGKTTLARALASGIPEGESILVIEDTPEIRLTHPHVRYMTTRSENSDGAGKVSPSECIRAGMRMAMNRIVFGEIRDAEAAESFVDVCASGHPGLSTIHAKSAADAIGRLSLFLGRAQKGASESVIASQVAASIQVIVHVGVCKITGKRRILEVREIGPMADNVIRQREMFRYAPINETPAWRVVTKSSAHKEDLEEQNIFLHELPAIIQLGFSAHYREAVN